MPHAQILVTHSHRWVRLWQTLQSKRLADAFGRVKEFFQVTTDVIAIVVTFFPYSLCLSLLTVNATLTTFR
ncbi:hypothetical protein [Mastigocladopsis repens]|uniref:hypothetical protein n=1 Tax=Mastigocladopsis repens TaxID=221287 RepID=UPI0012EA1F2A|nr:hypothetical protein [Mastigocladopsis repens]